MDDLFVHQSPHGWRRQGWGRWRRRSDESRSSGGRRRVRYGFHGIHVETKRGLSRRVPLCVLLADLLTVTRLESGMRSVDIVNPAVARKFTAGSVPAYCAVPFDTRIVMISEHEVNGPGFGPTYSTPIPARGNGTLVAGGGLVRAWDSRPSKQSMRICAKAAFQPCPLLDERCTRKDRGRAWRRRRWAWRRWEPRFVLVDATCQASPSYPAVGAAALAIPIRWVVLHALPMACLRFIVDSPVAGESRDANRGRARAFCC